MENEKFVSLDIEPKGFDLPTIKTELTMSEVKIPDKPGLTFGIQETKDVVKLGVSLANTIISALKDGKITLTDVPSFIAPIIKIPAAISGIEFVPAELQDLTGIEMQELIQVVQEDLTVDDAKAKLICEKSINVIYQVYELVKTIKE